MLLPWLPLLHLPPKVPICIDPSGYGTKRCLTVCQSSCSHRRMITTVAGRHTPVCNIWHGNRDMYWLNKIYCTLNLPRSVLKLNITFLQFIQALFLSRTAVLFPKWHPGWKTWWRWRVCGWQHTLYYYCCVGVKRLLFAHPIVVDSFFCALILLLASLWYPFLSPQKM